MSDASENVSSGSPKRRRFGQVYFKYKEFKIDFMKVDMALFARQDAKGDLNKGSGIFVAIRGFQNKKRYLDSKRVVAPAELKY